MLKFILLLSIFSQVRFLSELRTKINVSAIFPNLCVLLIKIMKESFYTANCYFKGRVKEIVIFITLGSEK